MAETISIHVPRVEDDGSVSAFQKNRTDFNPRPPCGGRHEWGQYDIKSAPFQSTSPVWRTTEVSQNQRRKNIFQSTSPVWRTTWRDVPLQSRYGFQSTSPVWRTTGFICRPVTSREISIHVPRVEDDQNLIKYNNQ